MQPLLEPGERILVNKLAYRTGDVERGDVVVLRGPDGRTLVKRVAGLPGERVEIVAGRLLVDGFEITEPYVTAEHRSRESAPARDLGEGEYFVLGDNRGASLDSRTFGPVRRERLRGRAAFIYWPLGAVGSLPEAGEAAVEGATDAPPAP